MKYNKTVRYLSAYALLLVLLALLLCLNLRLGSTAAEGELLSAIVWRIRMPRLIAAFLIGGALSVSGFLLQTFFANPIAGPFILGVSSSAKLTVALAMIFALDRGFVLNNAAMILSAFAGSMLSMGFVLLLSGRVRQTSFLVICGVMIGYLCSAVTDFVVTFADDANIVNLHHWSLGSFAGTGWNAVRSMAIVITAGVQLAFLLSKPMEAYQMGEAYARNAGVNLRRLRVELILLSSLLSACATAFAGPVSFVGVAVPHLVKRKCVQFRCVNLSLFVQYFLVSQHIYNPSQHPQAIRLLLHLYHFTLQCQGIFHDNRRVHPAALFRMKAAPHKLVRHFVGAGDSKKVRRLKGVCTGNRKRKRLSHFEIRNCLVAFLQIERHHILRTNSAPGHHHDIHRLILIVGADHIGRHRIQPGMYSKVLLHVYPSSRWITLSGYCWILYLTSHSRQL